MKEEKVNKHKVLKTILKFIGISFLVWIVIGIVGFGVLFKSVSRTIKVEEYQTYLENKYGKDKNFRMLREGSGDFFNTGDKQYWFVSNEASDEFSVVGSFSNGKHVFVDNYIEVKYKQKLESYYKDLFDTTLGGDCKINYTIADSENLNPNTSFEEYLKYEDLNLHIYFNYVGVDSMDHETLKIKTKELIESNGIKNVEQIKSGNYIIYKRLEVK